MFYMTKKFDVITLDGFIYLVDKEGKLDDFVKGFIEGYKAANWRKK